MQRAVAGGMAWIRGGCLPLAEKLTLQPVAEALGELSRLDGGVLLETALGLTPSYVRAEVKRLLPGLRTGGVIDTPGRDEAWRRERLLSAVAELLSAMAGHSGLVLVIEDVHWADGATLDCLTYLTRGGRRDAPTIVATCRSDEAPLDERVATWLAHMRAVSEVEEVRLGPMSRGEVSEQVTALAGGLPGALLAEEVYARAEGNPFFTEQLVAAAVTDAGGGVVRLPQTLPGRLSELLAARIRGCSGDARAVLAGLAVAGRPLTEAVLCEVTGLGLDVVRRGLQELAAAQLLAADTAEGTHRLRHALLAEAVIAGLLPGERVALHERTARALAAATGETLVPEIAEHWAAAGRSSEELPARVAAARAAERVFGYAEAAAHWQRVIELCRVAPAAARAAGIDLPRVFVRAIDELDISGDSVRAGSVAEEAYERFASHPDPATAAVILHRAAYFRAIEAPATGLPLIMESLRLYEETPPSADHAEAWLDYGAIFMVHAQGRLDESAAAISRALEIAEAASAALLLPRILSWLALHAFLRGQIEDGVALYRRTRAVAEAAGDGAGLLWLATSESDALLTRADFSGSLEVAMSGLQVADRTGLGAWYQATVLASNAAESLLARGRTAEAAALIDPLTTGSPDRDHWFVHEMRAEIDLRRGDIPAATRRREQIRACAGQIGSIDTARETARWAAELALWAGRPGDALEEVQGALGQHTGTGMTIFYAPVLTVGMRACADLAEQARARRDDHRASAALAAASDLVAWVDQVAGAPFTDHPFVGSIPAERADWEAERTRLAGKNDPAAWSVVAKTWDSLGCPHRAAYARWRRAQAQLDSGQPATAAAAALRAAAAAAEGHAPLLAEIRKLAERARIPLPAPSADPPKSPRPAATPAPYGLTRRELAVLQLLAAGRTNAQIGAELYISPKTASVHVTSIFRKLGVSGRVQAAALAERAGLLDTPQS